MTPCRPSLNRSQKASRSGAPGNRHAIPTMATLSSGCAFELILEESGQLVDAGIVEEHRGLQLDLQPVLEIRCYGDRSERVQAVVGERAIGIQRRFDAEPLA